MTTPSAETVPASSGDLREAKIQDEDRVGVTWASEYKLTNFSLVSFCGWDVEGLISRRCTTQLGKHDRFCGLWLRA